MYTRRIGRENLGRKLDQGEADEPVEPMLEEGGSFGEMSVLLGESSTACGGHDALRYLGRVMAAGE
jgi:hypothetical protein